MVRHGCVEVSTYAKVCGLEVHLPESRLLCARSSVADSDFGLSNWQLQAPGKDATLLDEWQTSRWLRRVDRMEKAAQTVAEKHRAALLLASCFRAWSTWTDEEPCTISPSLRDDCWSVV
mmetsp:Transcript_35231/g.81209  ORF Transcript_35231/g.81209 Transcript_35231/m.81209 type:complete len:119 (-) Transcript_35231:44-400(-)